MNSRKAGSGPSSTLGGGESHSVELSVAILFFAVLFKVLSYYLASIASMQHTSSMTFSWVALMSAATVAMIMYKPWLSRGNVSERHLVRLVIICVLLIVALIMTMYSLRVMHPIRTILYESADLVLLPFIGYFIHRHRKAAIMKGAAIALVGFLLFMWYTPISSSGSIVVESDSKSLSPTGELTLTEEDVAALEDINGLENLIKSGEEEPSFFNPASQPDHSDMKDDQAMKDKFLSDLEQAMRKRNQKYADLVGEDSLPTPSEAIIEPRKESEDKESFADDPEPTPEMFQLGGSTESEPDAAGRRLESTFGNDLTGGEDTFASPIDSLKADTPPSPGRSRHYMMQARRIREYIDAHSRISATLACFLLVIGAWISSVRVKLQDSLQADTGMTHGELSGIVLTVAASILTPFVVLRWIFGYIFFSGNEDALSIAEAVKSETGSQSSVGKLAKSIQVVLQHAGPNPIIFIIIAAMTGIAIFVFYESAVRIHWGIGSGVSTSRDLRNSKFNEKSVNSTEMPLNRVIATLLGLFSSVILAVLFHRSQLTWLLLVGLIFYFSGFAVATINDIDIMRLYSGKGRVASGHGDSGLALSQMGSLIRFVILYPALSLSRSIGTTLVGRAEAPLSVMSSLTTHSSSAFVITNVPPSLSSILPASLVRILNHTLADKTSRRLLLFLCLNFSFMFVEAFFGWVTNSLGLISDAGHMFFDNTSLFIGLYASYMARLGRDSKYSYGYARYEVVAGYINAVFLVFIAFTVVFEALERLSEPPEIDADQLLVVSTLGLLVNIAGLIFFHDVAHSHGHGGGDSHGHSHSQGCSEDHHNENMYGVYLHVLADALGSVGVIISSLMIRWWGWNLADPVASIIISGLILVSSWPLLGSTAGPLLQRIPEGKEAAVKALIENLERVPGIMGVSRVHVWKMQGDSFVATVNASVSKGSEQSALQTAVSVIRNDKSLRIKDVCVQLEPMDGDGNIKEHHGTAATRSKSSSRSSTFDSFTSSMMNSHGHSHGGNPSNTEPPSTKDSHHHGHSHGSERYNTNPKTGPAHGYDPHPHTETHTKPPPFVPPAGDHLSNSHSRAHGAHNTQHGHSHGSTNMRNFLTHSHGVDQHNHGHSHGSHSDQHGHAH